MHHRTDARHCGAFQISLENSLVPTEPSAMASGKRKRAGRELLAQRDSVWESFAIVLSSVQMFFFQQTLGTITAVPIKVPQVSSLQRLAGQGPAVLPQVQNTASKGGLCHFVRILCFCLVPRPGCVSTLILQSCVFLQSMKKKFFWEPTDSTMKSYKKSCRVIVEEQNTYGGM